MKSPFVYRAGGVLSADIAVPEHEREVEFYSKILTTGDAPLWREDLMNNRGAPVIGLGARTAEYDMLPLQWMPHFQVADIATSAECAVEMGGKQLMRAEKDEWAVLVDPVGAAFGIIPVVAEESGSDGQNEPVGCISWLSLIVPEAQSSSDFYRSVVGWNAKPTGTEDSDGKFANFEMQIDDEISAAEICQPSSEHDGIPSVWLIHVPVNDLAESLRRVAESGGSVICQPTEGNYAVVRDPVGVYFALCSG